jgi:transposase InsO family protein
MAHANAVLTPRARLKLARLVVEDGWSIARAAERFQVSWPTAKRWAGRYELEGDVGMVDRSSRPHRMPRLTPQPVVRKIVHLRWKQRLGPLEIAARVPVAASTVGQVLRRCGISRLNQVDRATGEPVRRYEHPHPGSLIHVDVKKLGNVPDQGGWRYVGRRQGLRNRAATPGKPRSIHRGPKIGTAFVHTVIDDHSRVAYAEVHDDETAATAITVLRHAVAWFAARGVVVERVLSDNGSAYRSHAWHQACAELALTPKHTRPYRPQTNGKIERFHRTLAQDGPFDASISVNPSAAKRYPAGYTSTTTTGPTARPAGSRPSPA